MFFMKMKSQIAVITCSILICFVTVSATVRKSIRVHTGKSQIINSRTAPGNPIIIQGKKLNLHHVNNKPEHTNKVFNEVNFPERRRNTIVRRNESNEINEGNTVETLFNTGFQRLFDTIRQYISSEGEG